MDMEVEVDEAYLRALAAADDVIHPADAERYAALHDALRLEEGEIPSPEQVATAATAETPLQSALENLDEMLHGLRRGAASFAARPGEEAFVAALLSKAAEVEAARAEVMAAVDARRAVQEHDLRRMAATDLDAFDEEMSRAAKQAHRDIDLTIRAGRAVKMDQVVAAEYAAQAMAAKMAGLAARLGKGAAAFASRPGEEAVAVALRSKVASVERHTAEAQELAESYRTFRLSVSASVPHRYSLESLDMHFRMALTAL